MVSLFAFTGLGTINPSYLGGAGHYGLDGSGLAKFIANLIDVGIIVAGIATFAFLAMGGFRYITAGGDVKQTQEASKQMANAVIGLAIVVGAFALTRVLEQVFGISIFAPVFKGP